MPPESESERRYHAALQRGDVEGAGVALERGAVAGDVFCRAQLGVWLLLGHGMARNDAAGAHWVELAAQAGNSDARRLLATLYAKGRGVDAHWPSAIDWLLRGAQQGDRDALRQLAFLLPSAETLQRSALLALAADRGDDVARRVLRREVGARPALAVPDWERIRRLACRPELPAGEARAVHEGPQVFLRPEVLSPALCDYLMGVASPFLARASVNDPNAGGLRIDESRTNRFANFWLLEGDVVTDAIDRLLAELVGASVDHGEPLSVLHYRPGEEFAPHFDFFDPFSAVHAGEIARNGQRVITCLVYLNSGYAGGETAFVDAGFTIRGRTGTAVYWRNADEGGRPDRTTRHAGLSPTSGEKWLASKWFRDRSQTPMNKTALGDCDV
jgi:prolyl 4-hydroxylase